MVFLGIECLLLSHSFQDGPLICDCQLPIVYCRSSTRKSAHFCLHFALLKFLQNIQNYIKVVWVSNCHWLLWFSVTSVPWHGTYWGVDGFTRPETDIPLTAHTLPYTNEHTRLLSLKLTDFTRHLCINTDTIHTSAQNSCNNWALLSLKKSCCYYQCQCLMLPSLNLC